MSETDSGVDGRANGRIGQIIIYLTVFKNVDNYMALDYLIYIE